MAHRDPSACEPTPSTIRREQQQRRFHIGDWDYSRVKHPKIAKDEALVPLPSSDQVSSFRDHVRDAGSENAGFMIDRDLELRPSPWTHVVSRRVALGSTSWPCNDSHVGNVVPRASLAA